MVAAAAVSVTSRTGTPGRRRRASAAATSLAAGPTGRDRLVMSQPPPASPSVAVAAAARNRRRDHCCMTLGLRVVQVDAAFPIRFAGWLAKGDGGSGTSALGRRHQATVVG